MYKSFIILLISLAMVSCNKNNDDGINNNNPYLTPPIVNLTLNLNLPEYNPLRYPGNSIVLSQQGIKGIIVYNVNNDLYTAFDLTDPNHVPNTCSKMTVEGIIATCTCEDHNAYDIVTGQITPAQQNTYPMHQYRISRSGDNITVSN
ncbi:MAG: hypothetical protein R2776_05020 [Flavobacteriaceae bacterium]|nr:hypothetical protein [Flavobacteriaceae bacterium]